MVSTENDAAKDAKLNNRCSSVRFLPGEAESGITTPPLDGMLVHRKTFCYVSLTIPHLVKSVGRTPVCRAGGSGRTNQCLKITGKIRLAVLNTLPQFRWSHREPVNFNDWFFSSSYSLDREPTPLFENALEDAVSSVVAWPVNIHSWVGWDHKWTESDCHNLFYLMKSDRYCKAHFQNNCYVSKLKHLPSFMALFTSCEN